MVDRRPRGDGRGRGLRHAVDPVDHHGNVFPPSRAGQGDRHLGGVAAGTAALGPTGARACCSSTSGGGRSSSSTCRWRWRRSCSASAGVPTSRDPERRPRSTSPGALLSIVGVGALVYAIIEAPHRGWADAGHAGRLRRIAAVVLGLFAWRETTARRPDARPPASSATGGSAWPRAASPSPTSRCSARSSSSAQFLQLVLGPVGRCGPGCVQLPVSPIMLLVTPRVPSVVARYGVRPRRGAVGLALVAARHASCSRSSTPRATSADWWLALIPLAFGIAGTGAPLTTLMMSAVPAGRAGVGSAMNDASRELGGALGVAVLGSVLTTRYGSGWPRRSPTCPSRRARWRPGPGRRPARGRRPGGRAERVWPTPPARPSSTGSAWPRWWPPGCIADRGGARPACCPGRIELDGAPVTSHAEPATPVDAPATSGPRRRTRAESPRDG